MKKRMIAEPKTPITTSAPCKQNCINGPLKARIFSALMKSLESSPETLLNLLDS